MDTTTRFRIASVSKPITGLLVLRLADLGELELDAPVGKLLPELPEGVGRVTTRQLLTHTAGIQHYRRGETSHKREH